MRRYRPTGEGTLSVVPAACGWQPALCNPSCLLGWGHWASVSLRDGPVGVGRRAR
jgi:hypothetical protein